MINCTFTLVYIVDKNATQKKQPLISNFGNNHFAQNIFRNYTNAMKYSLNFCNENWACWYNTICLASVGNFVRNQIYNCYLNLKICIPTQIALSSGASMGWSHQTMDTKAWQNVSYQYDYLLLKRIERTVLGIFINATNL